MVGRLMRVVEVLEMHFVPQACRNRDRMRLRVDISAMLPAEIVL